VRGLGPIRRHLTVRRLIGSFLNVWEEAFFSLDGCALHVYRDSSCLEAMFSVPLVNVESLAVESMDPSRGEAEGDPFIIVLKTFDSDDVQLR
jgi:hypothetical protein